MNRNYKHWIRTATILAEAAKMSEETKVTYRTYIKQQRKKVIS